MQRKHRNLLAVAIALLLTTVTASAALATVCWNDFETARLTLVEVTADGVPIDDLSDHNFTGLMLTASSDRSQAQFRIFTRYELEPGSPQFRSFLYSEVRP